MDFLTIAKLFADSPELNAALDYESLNTYLDLVRLLKPDLVYSAKFSSNEPPERLPVSVHDFLKICVGLQDETAKLAWAVLRHLAWSMDSDPADFWKTSCARTKYLKLFLEHGACRGLGKSSSVFFQLMLLNNIISLSLFISPHSHMP